MLEFSIAAGSIHALINLLAIAIGLSSLVCLTFVGPLLRGRFRVGHRLQLLGKLLFAGLASLQAFAWHLYFYRQSHDAIELGYLVGAVVLGVSLWQLTTAQPASLHPRLARWLPPALACLAVLQLIGFAVATKCFADFKPDSSFVMVDMPGALVAHDQAAARTDSGTALTLYECNASPEQYEVFVTNTRKNLSSVMQRAILRDRAYIGSNCHGWVFTGGQYIILSRDVQRILDENGYVEVATPGLNDVVVYRNAAGDVIHTGIVRGFLDGHRALVEGKWGIEGTYLHLAEEQPYSQNISYWHTERASHALTIEPLEPATDTHSVAAR